MLMSCPECPNKLMVKPNGQPVLHNCSGHGGLLVPMVSDGTRAKITVVEREDYVGKEQIGLHENRPVMAVSVAREDGEDRVIFAPTAVGGGGNGVV